MTSEDFEKNLARDLNESQLRAVTYLDAPLLVVAGAGSGKTRVLTYKIAYLLSRGYHPGSILSLTFTNKAAREMNNRIASLVGDEGIRYLWSGTFHSIFSRVLRHEAQTLGYTSDYTIYDQADSRSLVKTIVKELELDEKLYKASLVAHRISEAKNRLVLPDAYAANAEVFKRDRIDGIPEVHKIYAIYAERLRKSNAMDFDDLLLNTYLLFRDYPEIRRRYVERFAYILVDEYQDTNYAQHCILSQLAPKPDSRICVVGDDAQSIYGFRGADISNILQFTRQYPGAETIKLECNYRSTQTIVNAANSIIRHNQSQIPKTVYSPGEVGELIRIIESYSDKEESLKLAGEIRKLLRQHSLGYDDIALLYRTNAQSRSFEDEFRRAGIPYRIYGGLSFYQRKEIKDIIAYFRLISNPNDEEALKRIINYPARGIGQTTIKKLQLAAAENGVGMWQAMAAPGDFGLDFNRGTSAKLTAFQTLIAGFEARLQTESAYSLALAVLKESGMSADFSAGRDPEDLSRRENVEELLNSIKAFEEERLEEVGETRVPLTDYLANVSLLTDTDTADDGKPKVTLMTIHAAKGLEFDAIFVTGMEDDLFPNSTAKCSPREMEEERRLFYVAVTRAKRFCTLSYAKSRYRYGTMEFSAPSPFLDEIDPRYVAKGNGSDKPSTAFSPRFTPAPRPVRLRPVAAVASPSSPAAVSNLAVGCTIQHERFGKGRVEAVEGSGDNLKARVNFELAGVKNLLVKFAKFKVLN